MDRLTSPGNEVSRGSGLRGALLLAVLLSLLFPASALADTTINTGPTGPTNDATPTFTFSSDNPLALSFRCRVDSDSLEACSGPGDSHTPDPALDDGTHTFEVQAFGLLDVPVDPPATRTFTVDTDPPDTTIDTGPTGRTRDDTPTFTFSSDEPGSTFQCRVDDDPFAACGPGSDTTPPLSDGPHTFEVKAFDAVDNDDPTPDTRNFTVDTDPPMTTIESGPVPNDPISDPTPTFTFSSDEPASTFECRIDGDPFAPCSGPAASHTTGSLSNGDHLFRVRAFDQAGNPDPDPPARVFTVDTSAPPDNTAPDTTITKQPKAKIKTKKKKAKVEVSFASEAGAAFWCRLDKRKYEPCTSPYSVRAKSKAGRAKKHTISVRAIDPSGNVGKAAVVKFRVLRKVHLRGSVAQRTVVKALKRHDFARRVVKAVQIDCRRRSGTMFACRFSSRFPGYRLKGSGKVELGRDLSYRFRVKAQGVRFTLTDENEKRRLSLPTGRGVA